YTLRLAGNSPAVAPAVCGTACPTAARSITSVMAASIRWRPEHRPSARGRHAPCAGITRIRFRGRRRRGRPLSPVLPSSRTVDGTPTAGGLQRDHLDQILERAKVVRIAGVQGYPCRQRSRGDEEIDGPGTAGLSAGARRRGVDAAAGSGGLSIERQRIERALSSPQPVLAARPLGAIV